MLETVSTNQKSQSARLPSGNRCRVAVIWIDWYAYHIARFIGIQSAAGLAGTVEGIELVGGVGVHAGLQFREDRPSDLPIRTLMPGVNWSDAGQLKLALRLWRHLSSLKPQMLLVPGYYTAPAIAAALWCKLHRCTGVLMTESTEADHARVPWKEMCKSLLIRALFGWAVTGGKSHVKYLRALGFRVDRIAHYYDVVDNDAYRRRTAQLREHPRDEYDLPEDYFLYVGRLAPEKNVERLLRAWISYRLAGGSWSLLLVGDGPSRQLLQSIASASGLDADVHFVGHRGSADLPTYYAFARCFVLPSTREPWGLVVNEAMASGLPVLVSEKCGCVEDLVVSGRNGFVFDPSSESEITFLLGEVENLSPHVRYRMGRASLDIIGQYSPSALGNEIERIYIASQASNLNRSENLL